MKKFIKEHGITLLVIGSTIATCAVAGWAVYKLTRTYDIFYEIVPNVDADAIDLLICGADKAGKITKDVLTSFDPDTSKCLISEFEHAYDVVRPA